MVDRAARGGARRFGHRRRSRRRDRPPWREAARRDRVRSPTARAQTLTLSRSDAVTSTDAGAITSARGLSQSGTVTGAHTETVTQPDANPGVFAHTRPRALAKPLTQAGTQVAGKGATNAVSPEEFTDFYAASFRRLVGQLYAMTGNHAEAQDAVQEAFIRAWAHRRRLERSGAPEAWVRATAWRIAVSCWQRARLGRVLMRSSLPAAPIDGPSPDRVALIEALRQVPAEQRRALVLYHVCDQSVAQIAAETGVPAGTVKARLARGRAALAPRLRDTAIPDGAASADRK
ncbi:MAG TPA: SigE family RNA polymerase sigma factor [Streptosporangiaceae bacterium]|nr:SigE family RNA polymerase sigma factor [Streptosporangiaceae bacterium]